MSGPFLQVRHLQKSFATLTVLDDFSLDVAPGEFLTIVGPSGCGKSTFLHIVGGFESQTAGTLTINGQAITAPGADRGMMFQDHSLFPWLTVLENVCWPLDIKRLPKAERLSRARAILGQVHLSRFGHLYPAQLSGGMRQRTALARLLALDPQMLLMDEPFGALDAQTRELLQEDLQTIWRRDRKTALFITHDIDEAIYLGTRVLVFSARPGRIKADLSISADKTPAFRKSAEYVTLRAQIWDILREEVLKAKQEEEKEVLF
jgi:NitT/TauT family transport system ATP-binding protein